VVEGEEPLDGYLVFDQFIKGLEVLLVVGWFAEVLESALAVWEWSFLPAVASTDKDSNATTAKIMPVRAICIGTSSEYLESESCCFVLSSGSFIVYNGSQRKLLQGNL